MSINQLKFPVIYIALILCISNFLTTDYKMIHPPCVDYELDIVIRVERSTASPNVTVDFGLVGVKSFGPQCDIIFEIKFEFLMEL